MRWESRRSVFCIPAVLLTELGNFRNTPTIHPGPSQRERFFTTSGGRHVCAPNLVEGWRHTLDKAGPRESGREPGMSGREPDMSRREPIRGPRMSEGSLAGSLGCLEGILEGSLAGSLRCPEGSLEGSLACQDRTSVVAGVAAPGVCGSTRARDAGPRESGVSGRARLGVANTGVAISGACGG